MTDPSLEAVLTPADQPRCMFCGGALTEYSNVQSDETVHFIDCTTCGRYQISVATEAVVHAMKYSRTRLQRAIRRANSHGFWYDVDRRAPFERLGLDGSSPAKHDAE